MEMKCYTEFKCCSSKKEQIFSKIINNQTILKCRLRVPAVSVVLMMQSLVMIGVDVGCEALAVEPWRDVVNLFQHSVCDGGSLLANFSHSHTRSPSSSPPLL